MSERRYFIETWGCQMNAYDSDRFAGQLERLGYTASEGADDADVLMLNTCSVREKAEHKMFSRLGRLSAVKELRPQLVVGVGGCVAQQEQGKILRRAPVVDFVVGTRAVGSLGRLLAEVGSGSRPVAASMTATAYDEVRPLAPGGRRRAYVTVVEGCDKTCSFCIVPTTRGKEVNRSPEAIIEEVRQLVADGVLEIELLGQNVNAYRYGDTRFSDLLRMVERVDGLHRLRFTTSHPREFTDDVIDAMASHDRICNHLHLPVQSGADSVLKRMYRGYDRARYVSRIEALRRAIPDVALSTDIIVGFPGETADEFEASMTLLDEVEFDQVFAFVYSPRPGTVAATLPDGVAVEEKEERLRRLFAHQDVIVRRKNDALVGRKVEVLLDHVTNRRPGMRSGRLRDNRVVNVNVGDEDVSPLINVEIKQALGHSLVGEMVLS